MKGASSVTPQTILTKVEAHLQEALLLLKEAHGGHCCKFTQGTKKQNQTKPAIPANSF
jgi:hypothetical protein